MRISGGALVRKSSYGTSNVGVAIINRFRRSVINSCTKISETSCMLSVPVRIIRVTRVFAILIFQNMHRYEVHKSRSVLSNVSTQPVLNRSRAIRNERKTHEWFTEARSGFRYSTCVAAACNNATSCTT